jgi:hypothetical protein
MLSLWNRYTDGTAEHSNTVRWLKMAHIRPVCDPEGREFYGELPVVAWPHIKTSAWHPLLRPTVARDSSKSASQRFLKENGA